MPPLCDLLYAYTTAYALSSVLCVVFISTLYERLPNSQPQRLSREGNNLLLCRERHTISSVTQHVVPPAGHPDPHAETISSGP